MTKAERDARQRLGEVVRRIVVADFEEHGPAMLVRLHRKDPAAYRRIVAENPWLPRYCLAIVERRARTAH